MFRLLRGVDGRYRYPTEARSSIRESLRIFGQIEEHLEIQWQQNSKTSLSHPWTPSSQLLFERLVTSSANTNRLVFNGTTSCGLTSQCFAALFFSQHQIASNYITLHTNGSDIVQLWGNWNLVLYGMWKRHLGCRPNNHSTTVDDYKYSTEMTTRLLRWRAASKADDLSAFLLQDDSEEVLPRVVFCNLTWVLLLDNKDHNNNNDNNNAHHDIKDHDTSQEDVKDHQFCIIKHNNDRFQLVQGYIGESSPTTGYCLSAWQNNADCEDEDPPGNGLFLTQSFSSRHGFQLSEMGTFLDKLHQFATSSTFDAVSYKELFGVFHQESANRAIWPSISFRELQDDSIDGYGDRFVANGITRSIQMSTTNEAKI
jgi:hypothetical protein